MKILLSGGGTLGSVTPLLAIVEALKSRSSPTNVFEIYWLGTRGGLEKELVHRQNINFRAIFSGKLRRYFSLLNLIDPVLIFIGFFQSLVAIIKFRPDIVLSAGGYVSVPVVWAAWFLHCPIIIHQQDIKAGLANRLMAPFARHITVTFEQSLKDFSPAKVIWTGNPVRPNIFRGNIDRAIIKFVLEKDLPAVLIMGGGTGAKSLNQLVAEIVPSLVDGLQIIHITGRGKTIDINWKNFKSSKDRYHQYEFLSDELCDAYAVAQLVISRAGLGTLTELANLAKPVILIPIPRNHQEQNAFYFQEKNAALVLSQDQLTPDNLLAQITGLMANHNLRKTLSENINQVMKQHASSAIIDLMISINRNRI